MPKSLPCISSNTVSHQILHYPTNALNYINCRYERCQCYGDIFRPVVCACARAGARTHTHTQQVRICRHNTDNVHIDKHTGTTPVILARHWLWFPDDGSCVNRNMSERLLHFWCVFNNPKIYIIECISCTITCLILLMHGATMKTVLDVKCVHIQHVHCGPKIQIS